MDLSTSYLGLELAHPIMPGASPLVDDLDAVKRLEDAGASAIVMHSLFEEQIIAEQRGREAHYEAHCDVSAEASSFLPEADEYNLGPDEYLEQIRRIRKTVDLPVIASLNGVSEGTWLQNGRLMEEAGASAIELNVYFLATDPGESSADIEQRIIRLVRSLKAEVTIPVAVKLSPYFTGLSAFATELEQSGADGLVLFNRFFQPIIDPEELEVRRVIPLSNSSELPLRLRWLAILSPQLSLPLTVSGGVHTPENVVTSLMAGATTVQMVSALLKSGPEYLAPVIAGVSRWLEEHEYESLAQLRGSMNLERCPDRAAYERTNYIRTLQSWQG